MQKIFSIFSVFACTALVAPAFAAGLMDRLPVGVTGKDGSVIGTLAGGVLQQTNQQASAPLNQGNSSALQMAKECRLAGVKTALGGGNDPHGTALTYAAAKKDRAVINAILNCKDPEIAYVNPSTRRTALDYAIENELWDVSLKIKEKGGDMVKDGEVIKSFQTRCKGNPVNPNLNKLCKQVFPAGNTTPQTTTTTTQTTYVAKAQLPQAEMAALAKDCEFDKLKAAFGGGSDPNGSALTYAVAAEDAYVARIILDNCPSIVNYKNPSQNNFTAFDYAIARGMNDLAMDIKFAGGTGTADSVEKLKAACRTATGNYMLVRCQAVFPDTVSADKKATLFGSRQACLSYEKNMKEKGIDANMGCDEYKEAQPAPVRTGSASSSAGQQKVTISNSETDEEYCARYSAEKFNATLPVDATIADKYCVGGAKGRSADKKTIVCNIGTQDAAKVAAILENGHRDYNLRGTTKFRGCVIDGKEIWNTIIAELAIF